VTKLSFRSPPPDIIEAAAKVARYMAEHDMVQLMGLERSTSQPLTKEQADRLRGLISRHARCQWEIGVTQYDVGENRRDPIVKDAAHAQQAVYSYLNSLKRK
jgi:hypothetical protein